MGVLATIALGVASCNSSIYDDGYDCDPKYYLRFVFDMNMEFANAFAKQVNSVEVWIFDKETQQLVEHITESGDALKDDSFMVLLNINPGDYHIVTWAGLKDNRHFKVMDEVTHLSHPKVRMERKIDESKRPNANELLDELFHSIIDINAPDENEMQGIVNGAMKMKTQEVAYGTETIYDPVCYWDENEKIFKIIYTASLIRDTNNIVLSLEHLSGEFNLDQIGIEMTDNNGTMLHDNKIDNSDEVITYTPWRMANGSLEQGVYTKAGFDINDSENKDGHYADFITSEISTARMTTDHDKVIRIYYKDTDQTVFSIPVNKWIEALRSAKYRDMNMQEFLDRENDFELMVFLQDDGRGGWVAVSVVINGWHIIDNGVENL